MNGIDADGRLHRYLGVKHIPLIRWFPWLWRTADCWRVEIPSTKVIYLPALVETGGASEGTYYSDTDDSNMQSSNANYATAQTGTNLLAASNAASARLGQQYGAETYVIDRVAVFFAAPSLPNRAKLSKGTLYLYSAADDSDTDFNVTIVAYTGAKPPTATQGNWTAFGAVSYGVLSTASWQAGYNAIPLNAAGKAAISLTAANALGLRSSRDISETAPSGDEYLTVYMADQAGTDNDPYLVLEYHVLRSGVGVGNPMIFD